MRRRPREEPREGRSGQQDSTSTCPGAGGSLRTVKSGRVGRSRQQEQGDRCEMMGKVWECQQLLLNREKLLPHKQNMPCRDVTLGQLTNASY